MMLAAWWPLPLLAIFATLAQGTRLESDDIFEQDVILEEAQFTPDEEMEETTPPPWCSLVGGAEDGGDAGCFCPTENLRVQCIGTDGKYEPLLGRLVTEEEVAGKTCACLDPKPPKAATIKAPTCTEDIGDCLYRHLPGCIRYLAHNLNKLLWWDMGKSVNYDTLARYYFANSKGKKYDISYRGNTIIVVGQAGVISALKDLVHRPGKGVQGTLRVSGFNLKGRMGRASELGNMAMGNVGQFYKRFGGIGLGAPTSIHDAIRPTVQRLYGTKIGEFEQSEYTGYNGKGDGNFWTDAALTESARAFLLANNRLDYNTPYCHWAISEYHKIIGIDADILAASETRITNELDYAKKLCTMQGTIVMSAAIPVAGAKIWKMTSNAIGDAIKWRKQVQKDYKKAIIKKLHLRDSVGVEDVAASIMDAHVFAGGLSVPNFIASCVAVLYRRGTTFKMANGNTGTLGQDFSITDFVWEVSRLMSPVHFVPSWYTNEGTGGIFGPTMRKVLACTACAQYDPRVWEPTAASLAAGFEEATKFKIRPTAVYEANSIGWADKAFNPQNPERDRWCPGKRLSISLTVSWLTAFLEVWDKWEVETPHTWVNQHLSPYVKKFSLVRTQEG